MSAVHPGPLFRRLVRNRSAVLLLVAEVAFGLAVSIHSAAIPLGLLARARENGKLEPETLFAITAWQEPERVAAQLQKLEGVRGVSRVERPLQTLTQIPVTVEEKGTTAVAWTLAADAQFPAVMRQGAIEGRWPIAADELAITRSLADALFKNGQALESTLTLPTGPRRVTAVIPDVVLASNWVLSPRNAVIRPLTGAARRSAFMVRADQPGFAARAEAALSEARQVTVESMTERIAFSNANATGTLYVIGLMVLVLLLVTALGAAAMVAQLVGQRTREIGLRRALGASRAEVVAHFVFETACVVSAGLLAGLALTALIAQVAGAPSFWLVIAGVASFWVVSLVAAWIPARRAALVSPAEAGRGT